ncbi:hypothetical protein IJ103_02270 [Candidatus Saccharibacteria bacterium]|nr:hypothetical protein [Candidatus Saccharibacteria bacterium]
MIRKDYGKNLKAFEDYTVEEHRELCDAAMREIKMERYHSFEEVFSEARQGAYAGV